MELGYFQKANEIVHTHRDHREEAIHFRPEADFQKADPHPQDRRQDRGEREELTGFAWPCTGFILP